MRRSCAHVLIAAALIVGVFGQARAASISFVPSSGTIAVGDSVDVFVYVMGLETDFNPDQIVSAYDLDVSYGSAVNAVGLTFGSGLGGPLDSLQDFNFLAGAVDFAEVSFLADADLGQLQGNTVLLATLMFQAVAPGTATLSFLSGADDVKGLNALPIGLTTADASITVSGVPAPIPEPGTLLLMSSALAGFAAYRRRRRVHD